MVARTRSYEGAAKAADERYSVRNMYGPFLMDDTKGRTIEIACTDQAEQARKLRELAEAATPVPVPCTTAAPETPEELDGTDNKFYRKGDWGKPADPVTASEKYLVTLRPTNTTYILRPEDFELATGCRLVGTNSGQMQYEVCTDRPDELEAALSRDGRVLGFQKVTELHAALDAVLESAGAVVTTSADPVPDPTPAPAPGKSVSGGVEAEAAGLAIKLTFANGQDIAIVQKDADGWKVFPGSALPKTWRPTRKGRGSAVQAVTPYFRGLGYCADVIAAVKGLAVNS